MAKHYKEHHKRNSLKQNKTPAVTTNMRARRIQCPGLNKTNVLQNLQKAGKYGPHMEKKQSKETVPERAPTLDLLDRLYMRRQKCVD